MTNRATRATARKEALDHVLKEVMYIEDDDMMLQALTENGIKSIPDILSMSDVDMIGMSYKDLQDETFTIPLHAKNKLRILKAWNYHLLSQYDIKQVNWRDVGVVNADEYDDFRVRVYNPDAPTRGIATPPTTPPPSHPKPGITPAIAFRRGLKRDKLHYGVLKERKAVG